MQDIQPTASGTIETQTKAADKDQSVAELRAKQKTVELSAATKARCTSGQMAGPVQKRQATTATPSDSNSDSDFQAFLTGLGKIEEFLKASTKNK